jgi:hypothetical protein
MRVEPDLPEVSQRGEQVHCRMRDPCEIASNRFSNRYDSIKVISGLCCFSSVQSFLRLALHLPLRASAAHMLSAD